MFEEEAKISVIPSTSTLNRMNFSDFAETDECPPAPKLRPISADPQLEKFLVEENFVLEKQRRVVKSTHLIKKTPKARKTSTKENSRIPRRK